MKIMKDIDSYLYDQINDKCYVKYAGLWDEVPETEWVYVTFSADMLRLQDVLDEVQNADPYEKLRMYKNQFGDIVVMARSNIEWSLAYIEHEQWEIE